MADERNTLVVGARLEIKLPTLPNYLLVVNNREGEDDKIHISKVSKEDLKMVGKSWTKKLMEKGL